MKPYRLLALSAALLLTGLMVYSVSSQTAHLPAGPGAATPLLATVVITGHTRVG